MVVGSGLYERDFRALETRHSHIGARRVAGLGMSARIETLFVVAGTRSAHNMYLLACANKLDRCLRAHGSSVLSRLHSWLAAEFDVYDWSSKPVFVALE